MRGAGRLVAGAAALAAVAVALLAGAPAAASDDDLLERWRPTGAEGWVVVDGAPVVEASLHGCAAGAWTSWSAGEAAAYLQWMRCGSPEAAVAALGDLWRTWLLAPAPIEPVLGAESELGARAAPWDPATYRLWSQGEYVLLLGRGCADAGEGADGSADGGCDGVADARSLSALVPGAPNAIPAAVREPARDAADVLVDWRPASPGDWSLRYSLPADTSVDGVDGGRCGDGFVTAYLDATAQRSRLFAVDCGSSARALALAVDYWGSSVGTAEGLGHLLDSGHDGAAWTRSPAEGYVSIMRWWVQGTRYLQLDRVCLADEAEECGALSAADALAAMALSDDDVQSLVDFGRAGTVGFVLVGVPVLTFLAVLVPRWIVSRIRQRDRGAATANPRYVAVDGLVRRAFWGRRLRRILVVALGTVAIVAGALVASGTGQLVAFVLVLLVGPLVLYPGIALLLRLIARPHRLVRPPREHSELAPGAVVGGMLRGLAVLIAYLVVQLYLWATLFAWIDGLKTDAVREQSILYAIENSEGVSLLFNQGLHVLLLMERSNLVVFAFFVAVAIPLFLAYLLDRLGRRLARRSLPQVLARDRRPYFLYLRGFDEDRLRVDESLGRRGFLELFSMFGRPRFEEVLAEQLSKWGPVIAISGSHARLPDLGAAKTSLGGDQWQDRVREWVGDARAVVLSATPESVRGGLRWEIEHLAGRPDAPPIMLVLAPWPARERRRRWEGFLAAVADLPMFAPLRAQPFPPQTNILTHRRDRGWTGYGARRRWDWSYGASILAALEAGDLEAAPAPPSTPTSPSHPGSG